METQGGRAVRRVAELDESGEPAEVACDQTVIVMDEMFAQLIRNTRTGRGKSLRELGFTATADELGL